MNLERLEKWLEEADIGDTIMYMQADYAGRRPELRNFMWKAAEIGAVCLFQKRVRPGIYSYFAKKVSTKTGKILKPWDGKY